MFSSKTGVGMSFYLLIAWLLFGLLALGPAAFIFLFMKRSSKKNWPTSIDHNYKPRISVIVPTYNESSIILFKLINLSRLNYPRNLKEIVIVDSASSDDTVEIARQFSEEEPEANIKIIVEKERKGKSHALNYALPKCKGDVIVISDADCFWPSDILEKSVPFLADPDVGAISGPKIILNSNQSWVTRLEQSYLKSANILRLGESKSGSSVFSEGGFSAFKRSVLGTFDPYSTGSDDCGTMINVIEKNFRAMLVPEAKFYTPFPTSFRGKISIKLRRINQLVKVFAKYLDLLVNARLNASKITVVPNILLYILSPVAFVFFIVLTALLVINLPYLLLALVLLLVPAVRFYLYEIFENNLLLLIGICGVAAGKSFSVWSQPEDRTWLTREALSQLNLI
jgi:biofilm PGA synthesis N-glycosyltransferase PgaC